MRSPENISENNDAKIEGVQRSFRSLEQEVGDIQKLLRKKEGELVELFRTHKKLILERLKKMFLQICLKSIWHLTPEIFL